MNAPATEVVLTREELYERVWSTPMQRLAREFGLSDVGLAKLCKRHKIPRPSRGYWAKLEAGKAADKWPLAEVTDPSLNEIRLNRVDPPAEPKLKAPLAVDPEIAALIEGELLEENRIHTCSDLRGADPLVVATRDSLSGGKADEFGRIRQSLERNAPYFDVFVSKPNIHRSLLLLQTMVKAFRLRGIEIALPDPGKRYAGVVVLGEQFRLSLYEPSKRQKRELTAAELEEKKRYRFSFAREYEHVPTGILELHINRDTYWSAAKLCDTKSKPLETRLNELIVLLYKAVDRRRIEHAERRREEEEAERRKRHAVKKEVLRRSEGVRIHGLTTSVPRWEDAGRLRRYIAAVRAAATARLGTIDPSSEVAKWLDWAERYVCSLDPLDENCELPSYAPSAQELDRLARECEEDWCGWSNSFNPRKPR